MQFWQTAVGRKIIMALTGLLMILFLLGHMAGNLSFFLGPEVINAYAEHIKSLGPLLWLERLFMVAVLVVHVWLGINLTLENSKARPEKYEYKKYLRTTFSSRTMIYTGLIILGFLIYHLLHFTLRLTNPEHYQFVDVGGHFNVYKMAGLSFANIFISLIYTGAMGAVLLHLWHGVASFFQTMGWNSDKYLPKIENLSKTLSMIIFLVFISIPAFFYFFGLQN